MNWLTRHIPTRDTIHRYRLLRPFAPHLTQSRAVADDPALGAARGGARSVRRRDIPLHAHVIAALLAIPRAPMWRSRRRSPFSTRFAAPPIYYAAYRIGSWELHHDATLVDPAAAAQVSGEFGAFHVLDP